MSRRFDEPKPISRANAEAMLAAPDPESRTAALLALAYHDPDWRWVQDRCLGMLADQPDSVRAIAALCLGHLARLHRRLDLDRVLPALTEVLTVPEVGSRARDALDDIEVFITGRH